MTGVRQDPWAQAHRIQVEEDKAEQDCAAGSCTRRRTGSRQTKNLIGTRDSRDDPGRGAMSAMIDQLRARLAELKREYQLGDGQLRELTRQEATLRETLLRISGAIQVLEELLSKAPEDAPPPAEAVSAADEKSADENGTSPREILTVP